MATLYEQKTRNIAKTWLLMTIFFGVIIGIGFVFSQIYRDPVILFVAVGFSLLMNIVSYWFSDKIALALHRAKPVDMRVNPELFRILENLTIAAGLPMPRLYVIEDAAPNAFATGRNPKRAVVAVTTGLLNMLDRSELEGVLAHELSHIGNRDMLVSTVAVVLVGVISMVSDIFLRSMWWGGDRDRESPAWLYLVGILLSLLAPLLAMILQLAISRKREFLADASSALLTRYPDGLISGLKKISGVARPMATATNATAHLFFGNPFGADRKGEKKTPWLVKIFSTHPPIEERIRALQGMEI